MKIRLAVIIIFCISGFLTLKGNSIACACCLFKEMETGNGQLPLPKTTQISIDVKQGDSLFIRSFIKPYINSPADKWYTADSTGIIVIQEIRFGYYYIHLSGRPDRNLDTIVAVQKKKQTIHLESFQTSVPKDFWYMPDQMPEYPGGLETLARYIATEVNYPVEAMFSHKQGVVLVTFIIDTDGSLSDFKVFKKIDRSLDEEALRVVKSMKKWKPGKVKGMPVRTFYAIPVSFLLI